MGISRSAPAKHTAPACLAAILGILANEGLVQRTIVPATGYWSYNTTVGPHGSLGSAVEPLSWVRLTVENLGVDPEDWPSLGYRSSELVSDHCPHSMRGDVTP